mmetsp:Transcript_31439/g.38427  ORF Transcript_31439/g.38427 Transcript_31439/m.38427 type:complete len:784 (+) Transcript_31439:2-2353(+)
MGKQQNQQDIVFRLMNGKKEIGINTVTFTSILNTESNIVNEKIKIGKKGASFEFCVTMQGIEIDHVHSTGSNFSSGFVDKGKEVIESGMSQGGIEVEIVSGRGFKVRRKKSLVKDIPDVYCKAHLKLGTIVFRTSTVKNKKSPVWKESGKFSVSLEGLDDAVLSLDVWDQNHHWDENSKGDEYLGYAEVKIVDLLRFPGKNKDVELLSKKDSKGIGAFITLNCKDLSIPSAIMETLTQAERPDKSKSEVKVVPSTEPDSVVAAKVPAKGDAATANESLSDADVVLSAATEAISETGASGPIKAERSLPKSPLQGRPSPPSPTDEDKSYEIVTDEENKESDVSQGGIEVEIVSGSGFKVERKGMGLYKDIPDVYCKAQLKSGTTVFRTSTVKNNVSPVWKESGRLSVSLEGLDDAVLSLDVWDQNHHWDENSKGDEYLGYAEVKIVDLLRFPGKNKDVELLSKKDSKGIGAFITLNCKDLSIPSAIMETLTQAERPDKSKSEVKVVPSTEPDSVVAAKVPAKGDAATANESLSDADVDASEKINSEATAETQFHKATKAEAASECDASVPVKIERCVSSENTVLDKIETPIENDSAVPKEIERSLPEVSQPNRSETPSPSAVGKSYEIVTPCQNQKLPLPESRVMTAFRLTTVSGHGFKTHKKFFTTDIPDIYCQWIIGSCPEWKTTVQKNTVTPEWNQTHEFQAEEDDIVLLEAFDANSKGKDNLVGRWAGTVKDVLGKAHMEIELARGKKGAKDCSCSKIDTKNGLEGKKDGLMVKFSCVKI